MEVGGSWGPASRLGAVVHSSPADILIQWNHSLPVSWESLSLTGSLLSHGIQSRTDQHSSSVKYSLLAAFSDSKLYARIRAGRRQSFSHRAPDSPLPVRLHLHVQPPYSTWGAAWHHAVCSQGSWVNFTSVCLLIGYRVCCCLKEVGS